MRRNIFFIGLLLVMTASVTADHAHSQPTLRDEMRRLWIDHAAWTRMYIVSAAAGLPDTEFAAKRLMRNQEEIGNAVAPFYGKAAGDQLTALLKDHIAVAAELVGAAKAGDNAKVKDASARWYRNADEIALFLNKANPTHWPADALKSMMRTHLDQTVAEATHRLQGKYEEDIRDYDEIVRHMIMMADALSDGIAAQFPAKFATK